MLVAWITIEPVGLESPFGAIGGVVKGWSNNKAADASVVLLGSGEGLQAVSQLPISTISMRAGGEHVRRNR